MISRQGRRLPGRLLTFLLVLLAAACTANLPAAPAGRPALTLDALQDSLDGRQSYQLTLKLRFTGQSVDSGQNQTVLIDTFEEKAVIREQVVRHFLFLSSGAPGLPGALEFYKVGDLSYALSSAQGSDPICQPQAQETGAPFQAGSGFDLLPQAVWQSLSAAQLAAQGVTINGVPTDHYRIEAAAGADGRGQVDGDLWIAQQGGTLVRFRGALQGPVSIHMLNGDGILGWEYELTAVNQLSELPVPEQCLALNSLSIALPGNAVDVLQSSTLLSFTSPSSPAELLAFFQDRLADDGWTIDQEGGGGGIFSLSASRGEQAILVTIGPQDGGQTLVRVEPVAGPR